ncbi:MAG: hypothetical protein NXI32_31370, partial [bacterium]|nr:hypothetical protein [bacterium]
MVNWATYGSSGHQHSSEDLVVERFVKRGNDDWVVNRHYKTIVRARAAHGVKRNPHLIGVHDALETIQTSGAALVNHSEKGEGVSAQVIWDHVRINHFVVKSRQEFFDRKRPRGRATVAGQTRDEAFFLNHDRNEVDDPTPTWLVEATRAEISRLARHVTNARPDTAAVGSRHPQTVRLRSWSRSLKAILRNAVATRPHQATPSRPSTHGAVDKVAINDHSQVQVTGWALLGRSAVPFLSVKLGDQVIEDYQIERRARADVVRHLSGSDLRCGFTISFPLELIRRPADPAVISILASTSMDGETRVVARHHAWPPGCVIEKLHASQQPQRPSGVAIEMPLGIPTESQRLLWPTE